MGTQICCPFSTASLESEPLARAQKPVLSQHIRGALAADDALKRQGLAIRFRVRETPDWKKHAVDLESENAHEAINKQGTSIFMVEQNANMALSIADYGYVLQTGEVVLQARPRAYATTRWCSRPISGR